MRSTTVSRILLLIAALGLHELMEDLGIRHFAMNKHVPCELRNSSPASSPEWVRGWVSRHVV